MIRKGERHGPLREKITAQRIAAFRGAIGAKAGESAPPTFMTLLRGGEFELMKRFGIQLKNVLHAEQTYRYKDQIRAGDELEYETVLSNVLEKRGKSAMHFMTFDTEVAAIRDGARISVGSCHSIIVYRVPPA